MLSILRSCAGVHVAGVLVRGLPPACLLVFGDFAFAMLMTPERSVFIASF